MARKSVVCLLILLMGIGVVVALKGSNEGSTPLAPTFDAGGRYDADELDYMGVIYENRTDIVAFNEGYSESDNCPWGFVHNGIDYFFRNGSTVIAAAPGLVESIDISDNGENVENRFYITVVIRFNASVVVHYNFEPWTQDSSDKDLQLEMLEIQEGDWVDIGEKIADFLHVGGSAHIHFGVIKDGQWQNPEPYFSENAYNEIMAMIHSFHPDWDLYYP